MSESSHKLRFYSYAFFGFIALFILADFALPGKNYTKEIVELRTERQKYFNAAGNSHLTYKVITDEHKFLVKEDFVQPELKGKQIEYTVSPLFKEVNWYRLQSADSKSSFSLRLASGLVLPLVTLFLIFLAYRYNNRIGTLLFVAETLLLGNLIFLMT